MQLDDFDSEPVALAEAPIQSRAEIELEQTEKIRRYRTTRDLIVSPEVAAALRDGFTIQEIADVLGVSPSAVYRHMKSAEMGVLIDRESRRVLRHLTTRKLKDEKYRDLTLALGVLIDKARLLRNEPTEIIRTETGAASRLALLVFGQSAGGSTGDPVIEITPEPGEDVAGSIPEGAHPSEPESGGNDPHENSSESGG